MNGLQISEEISRNRGAADKFIRWWRKENDFVDYELLDRFLDNANENQEFAGYELLDVERMWDTLKKRLGDRVRREQHRGAVLIVWNRGDKGEQSCPYSAESIMTIFDVETRGNVIEQ